MTRSTSIRSFHHEGLTPLSPDGVPFFSTLSKLSPPMNRNWTGWAAHCVNSLVSGSTAASSMALSLTHDRRHGGWALPSATVIATTVCVPMVAGQIQFGGGCLASDGAAGAACMRPTASGIENHWGAERPNRPAKSMAAVSKRSC
jgi:hypothetical protein